MNREDAANLLRWYGEIGVDEAVCDDAVDRFAASSLPPARPPPRPPAAAAPARKRPDRTAPAEPRAALAEAQALAQKAASIEELLAAIDSFEGCALKRTATRTCVSDGNPRARIMVIGEAPGADEDRMGKPFVGRAGKLLDRMLATVGLDRSMVYITNTLYWRPPGNRTPTPEEIAVCLPFLERQVELIQPGVLVYAGGTAVKAMLSTGPGEGITRLRGRWFRLERPGREPIPAIAMFHPAYLLRQPAKKRESWHDLLAIRARADELGLLPAAPAG